jgi:hypothetical protein
MLPYLLITSLLLLHTLCAPINYASRQVYIYICASHGLDSTAWPTITDYRSTASSVCTDLIPADAPNLPLLPRLFQPNVNDPANPPVLPPLSTTRPFHIASPKEGEPDVLLSARFIITGVAPVSRESCLKGFGAEVEEEMQREQQGKGSICAGKESDEGFVQKWNATVGWNRFEVSFGKPAMPIEIKGEAEF